MEEKRMRALALGGGGVKGEFELGALEYLSEKGCGFDFFSGVSVGALNASVVAQHQRLGPAVSQLKELWDEIESNSDIYTTPFPGGGFGEGLGALLALASTSGWARDAIHGSKPLRERIAKHVTWKGLTESKKMWAIGAASMTDGVYYLVANDADLLKEGREPGSKLELTLEAGRSGSIPDKLVDFILASSSMPVFFPPLDIYGHRFVDGGLRDITPLSSAFKAAKSRKIPPSEVDIVVISTTPEFLGHRDDDALDSGREIAGRTIDIMAHEILRNDLKWVKERNNKPGRLMADVMALRPDYEPGLGSLDFGAAEERAKLRRHGREVAARTFTSAQLAKLADGTA